MESESQLFSLQYLPALSYVVVFYNEDSFVVGYNQDTPESIMNHSIDMEIWNWLSNASIGVSHASMVMSNEHLLNECISLYTLHTQRPILFESICIRKFEYMNVIQRIQAL